MVELKEESTVVSLQNRNLLPWFPEVTKAFFEVSKSNLLVCEDSTNQTVFKDLDGGRIGTEVQRESLF
jgi:hypothetical protein